MAVDSIEPVRELQYRIEQLSRHSGKVFVHHTSLVELRSVYLLWTLGVGAAVLVFALEIVYRFCTTEMCKSMWQSFFGA